MSKELELDLFRTSKEIQFPALVGLQVLDPDSAEKLINNWFNTSQTNELLSKEVREKRMTIIQLNQTVEEKERAIKKEGVAGLIIGALMGAATVSLLVMLFGG